MKRRIVLVPLLIFATVFSMASTCTTSKCVNGSCTVTIQGGSGSTTVDGLNDLEVAVTAVHGDRVQVRIGGNPAVLTRGTPSAVAGRTVTAKEVTPDKVVLKIS